MPRGRNHARQFFSNRMIAIEQIANGHWPDEKRVKGRQHQTNSTEIIHHLKIEKKCDLRSEEKERGSTFANVVHSSLFHAMNSRKTQNARYFLKVPWEYWTQKRLKNIWGIFEIRNSANFTSVLGVSRAWKTDDQNQAFTPSCNRRELNGDKYSQTSL